MFLPFNFRPADTFQFEGSAATYTVPAGKHAYISATMIASCEISGLYKIATDNTISAYSSKSDLSEAQNFWLKPGDVITVNLPADSSGSIAVIAGTVKTETFTVELLINATVAMKLRAVASVYHNDGGVTTTFASIKSGSVSFNVSEYNPL